MMPELNMEEPKLPRKKKLPARLEEGKAGSYFYPPTPKSRYHGIYFEALDCVTSSITRRFDQPEFKKYVNLQEIFLKTIKQQPWEKELEEICKIDGDYIDRYRIESQLMTIFQMFCFHCKTENPEVQITRNGTMATVIQTCKHCGTHKQFKWRSQPFVHGRYPAGNIIMSFGILLSGVNISQTLLMFRHMGLAAISPRTYFSHQKNFLFPSIFIHWEKYQAALIAKLRCIKHVQWSGDGRFDSMGHNAK